jgi:hypothetical protein
MDKEINHENAPFCLRRLRPVFLNTGLIDIGTSGFPREKTT